MFALVNWFKRYVNILRFVKILDFAVVKLSPTRWLSHFDSLFALKNGFSQAAMFLVLQ